MSSAARRDTERALSTVLREAGISDWRFEYGRGHTKLRVHLPGGRSLTYSVPWSPSDWRGVRNARSQLRRMLRERLD